MLKMNARSGVSLPNESCAAPFCLAIQGDVTSAARGEVLDRLRLNRLARSYDHDTSDALSAKILHERGHEIGLADTRSQVHDLDDFRIVVAVERGYELAESLLVRGAQVELGTDGLDKIRVEGDVEPLCHYLAPPFA